MLHSAEGCNPGAFTALLPEQQSSSIFLLIELLLRTDLQSLQLAAIKHDKVVNISTSVCEALEVYISLWSFNCYEPESG